ncbi:hypothetical protein D3C78_899120 [compost metagenome]
MADLVGVLQLEHPVDSGVKLAPSGTGFVAVGYDMAALSGSPLQPMVGGRRVHIDNGEIKALPEATA